MPNLDIQRPVETGDNFYTADPNLSALLDRYLSPALRPWAEQELVAFGALIAGEVDRRADFTDKEGRPVLVRYDKWGNDISEVRLNEGYRQTAKAVYESGIVSCVFRGAPGVSEPIPYLYSFAQGYLVSQAEAGFYCPVTLTLTCAYVLHKYGSSDQKARVLSRLTAPRYEELWEGATWLTERQGGSDVGANTTVAVREGDRYRLTGEKFFASNAGACHVALVTARVSDAPGTKGLGLFLVPWRKEDGSLNGVSIRRLKNKLGVIAVPSAEVLLNGAEGEPVGDLRQGIRIIMDGLNVSRIGNVMGSLGILRRAFFEARRYTAQREAFGHPVQAYPAVRKTLVDLLLDLEGLTDAAFRMIHHFDRVERFGVGSDEDRALYRLLVPILKHCAGEASVRGASRAIELHGGNGYIEDFVTPRLLRDAQVTTVWEGTANILALDVLRALRKEGAQVAFPAAVRGMLEACALEEAQPMVRELSRQLAELEAAVTWLFAQSETVQADKALALTEWLADVFVAALLLEEATWEWHHKGNARKLAVARLWYERAFAAPKGRGVTDTRLVHVRGFEPLVYHQAMERPDVARLFAG